MYEKLKYASTERVFEGVIVELTDASVTIDIKGRLGQFKIPLRMLISQYDVKVGQEVAFLLSYPEVLSEEPNEHYVSAINNTKKLQEDIQNKNK
ncbi:CBO2463/CBO2479 domain-containing protein [Gemelliphila palaticanis]|uniref:Uncharacterized protein n=1 Tax=Gemelliphila palaticanis TaxID=81950 RepID=A0ABX2SZJ0_9BACL|nr:CBO2463/CBO2479 domain-containing protein [Gemella palaticanis]MBF0715866.1 hypothetical protein [Gemella palaticanis]NYS47796.1 hypothetical protein [Gemella palaticanis]